MTQFGENREGVSQLNNTHYKHTILVPKSYLPAIELFTLTSLSICIFYFGYYRRDTDIGTNLKIIAWFSFVLIAIGLHVRHFYGVKSGGNQIVVFFKLFADIIFDTGSQGLFIDLFFTESLYVVKALGLQTTTVFNSNFKSSKFIPWHAINDVVINEAIVKQKVIFYLAVLVKSKEQKGGESIIPVFIKTQPRLSQLKRIYTSIQLILRD